MKKTSVGQRCFYVCVRFVSLRRHIKFGCTVMMHDLERTSIPFLIGQKKTKKNKTKGAAVQNLYTSMSFLETTGSLTWFGSISQKSRKII